MRLSIAYLTVTAMCVKSVSARVECTNTTKITASTADYLFVVDASSSMCPKIRTVASGLVQFSTKVDQSKILARYGIVQYGGQPKILLPFVNDVASVQSVLSGMGCTADGQEAAFEVLRGSVPPNNGVDFVKGCASSTPSASCILKWNSTASKVIILVTDEDSDLPTMTAYRMPGQSKSTSFCSDFNYKSDGTCTTQGYEPSFFPAELLPDGVTPYNMIRTGPNLRLTASYEAELELTASMLVQNGVFLNSLVSTIIGTSHDGKSLPVSAFNSLNSNYFADNGIDDSLADNVTVTTYQFGHPGFQVQSDNFSSFNGAATLEVLRREGFANSLQARMLSAGSYSRVFDIANFDGSTNQASIVQAFYNSIVETSAYLEQYCRIVADSSSSTSSLSSSIFSTTKAFSAILTSSSKLAATSVSTAKLSTSTATSVSTTKLSTSTMLVPLTSSNKLVTTSMATATVTKLSASTIFVPTTRTTTAGTDLTAQFSPSSGKALTESSTNVEFKSISSSAEVAETTLASSSSAEVAETTLASSSSAEVAETGLASSTNTDASMQPTALAISVGSTPNNADSNVSLGTIIGAVLAALCAVAVAAGVVLHQRKALNGLRRTQSESTAVGPANTNPLYVGKSYFKENPMYISKESLSGSTDALA